MKERNYDYHKPNLAKDGYIHDYIENGYLDYLDEIIKALRERAKNEKNKQ